MPQPGQFADVEQIGPVQRCQHPQVIGGARNRSPNERVASREREGPVGGPQAIKPIVHRVDVGEDRRDDRQAQFDRAGVAAEL